MVQRAIMNACARVCAHRRVQARTSSHARGLAFLRTLTHPYAHTLSQPRLRAHLRTHEYTLVLDNEEVVHLDYHH